MQQADSHDTRIAPEIPPESVINATLDPMGRSIDHHLHRRASPDQRVSVAAAFTARHRIAAQIELLIAILDAFDDERESDDEEREGEHGVDADDEPSLSAFDGAGVSRFHCDFEIDPAESGIGDLDGMIEQIGRAA